MMNELSFMGANFVARQADYRLTDGWGEGVRTTRAFFEPPETFEARFDALLSEVTALGFGAFDLWTELLKPAWASDEQIRTAKVLIEHHHLTVSSLAGGFGSTRAEFEANCELAKTLGAPVLGGNTALLKDDPEMLGDMLEHYDLRFGYENHPEKTPAELIKRIHGGDERIGVTLDTGWFGTHGYNAADAIQELAPHLFYVHLKDVKERGKHETCSFGAGVVPLEACVAALKDVGYAGPLSVEHEPETFDPTEDVRASKAQLEAWLAHGLAHGLAHDA